MEENTTGGGEVLSGVSAEVLLDLKLLESLVSLTAKKQKMP